MNASITTPREAATPEVMQRLGQITRQLHDSLEQLGLMPRLQQSAVELPDARSRLGFVGRKSGEAADKVLTAVDLAKQERQDIDAAVALLLAQADPSSAGAVRSLATRVAGACGRIDSHLTDIMLAQDFHDLTGQVVAKVVALAVELEASLAPLVVQAAPLAAGHVKPAALEGPVVDAAGRHDVVTNQDEVDNLLADLGF